jgi:cell filamentation protein
MKNSNKYNTTGMIEAEYEPGSNNKVLKNLLAITSKEQIDFVESQALITIQNHLMDYFKKNHSFTEKDIKYIHKIWLKKIYPWAGKYRTVNMTKGNFPFAAAEFIPNLMKEFELNFLTKYTPSIFETTEEIITALSIVHIEFILIHPFREGNGRLGRILSIFMALQAGLPLLNFDSITQNLEVKNKYFQAIRKGALLDYAPMKEIFKLIIEDSLQTN